MSLKVWIDGNLHDKADATGLEDDEGVAAVDVANAEMAPGARRRVIGRDVRINNLKLECAR